MRLRRIIITLLISMLLLIAGCSQTVKDDSALIAENGVAKAVIVIAEDASEPEQHAAAELSDFLEQITGAEFEIVSPPATDSPRLLIGAEAAKLAEPDFSTEGLGTDGVVIRRVDDDLILAGGHPRGTLSGRTRL